MRDLDTGRLVGSGRAAHPPTTPPRSEQHPDTWWAAWEGASAEAGLSGPGRRPGAVAVAAQQHGMVVCDADGRPLRPAKLWNDTESAPDAERLLAAHPGGRAGWAADCGSVPVAAFTVTKLAWLRRTDEAAFRRTARVLLPHDWLTLRLTGRAVTDRGDASGTGYWSPAEGRYRPDLLALVDDTVDWSALLPEVLGPLEPAGSWGPDDALVAPGTGDNMAGALGLGLRPGDLVLSFGTSATAFTVTEGPVGDPTGAVAGFADATGRYLPLVCTSNATKVTDAVMRLLGADADEFDALALDAQPGAGGLVLVPHLDGERTPNRPGATGRLAGIRSDVSRAQLARATVEGVVCNLLQGADRLAQLCPSTASGRLLLIGGGAKSRAYRQVVADLTGRPVLVPDSEDLVARGAAVQAAVVHSGASFDDLAAAWRLDAATTVEPVPGTDPGAVRAAYRAAADT